LFFFIFSSEAYRYIRDLHSFPTRRSSDLTWVGDVTNGVDPTVITRTYRAADASGNISECNQTITVQDVTAPLIDCPANVIVEFATETGAVVHFVVQATDNCDSGVVENCVPQSGSAFGIGATTIHCTASDASSNSASCSFTVTVLGSRGVIENVL